VQECFSRKIAEEGRERLLLAWVLHRVWNAALLLKGIEKSNIHMTRHMEVLKIDMRLNVPVKKMQCHRVAFCQQAMSSLVLWPTDHYV